MVPVRVCVLSSMFDGRDVENIRQEMEGRFAEKRGEWVLRYVEQSGEEAATRTTLRGREDCITVVRSGGLNFRHTYFPGKTTTSWVHTPAGSMEMEVTTRDYRRHRWEGAGNSASPMICGWAGKTWEHTRYIFNGGRNRGMTVLTRMRETLRRKFGGRCSPPVWPRRRIYRKWNWRFPGKRPTGIWPPTWR